MSERTVLKAQALLLFAPCSIETAGNRLLELLRVDPTQDKWLHRKFRAQYQRGHTFVRNQIVYQSQGYTCKRVNRHSVELQIQGLERGKKKLPLCLDVATLSKVKFELFAIVLVNLKYIVFVNAR